MILFWSSVTASLLAVVGCGYLVAATILVGRFARRPASAALSSAPGVTVLKPLHGGEPGLLENLVSFSTQDYPGPVQIVFGVQDANDDAVAVVRQLRNIAPTADLDLVVESKTHGLNRKVSNLINMAPCIHGEVVVIADSDMRVAPDYLSRVIAALQAPGVGAVTCLYHGVAVTGVWARLAALTINAQFLPSVVVGLALGLARPCFGSTIALRSEALARIGGLKAFADCLADDYAVGNALRAHGYKVSIPPFAIAHMCTQTSPTELWRHQLRWARTVRSIDRAGYAGSMVSHAFPWALIAVLAGVGSAALLPAIIIAIASLACRTTLLREVERAFALPAQTYWLVPASDLLSFAVFVFGFLGWDVSWKGRRYHMAAGGTWMADRGSYSP
jgi:ceramide glucosyltransferase